MSITRITEGEFITKIKKGWTVYTDHFEAYAGNTSHFTADNGTVFGLPETDDKTESNYFKDGWWSSDKEGNERITEAKIGQTVYFNIEMQTVTDQKEIPISLYDYDENSFADLIGITKTDAEGNPNGQIESITINGNRASLPLTLSPGIEKFAENDENDEIELFFECDYENELRKKLPKIRDQYLFVNTCDKNVVISYEKQGYGNCAFYQFRYNDFMRRHKDCGHVPPDYYYGPMLKINETTKSFYEKKAFTKEMVKAPVNLTTDQIKTVLRNGIETKPLLAYSYGFKYCIRFSHVLDPKLSAEGKKWLANARFRLQELMEVGVIKKEYEAKYDKIIESMESTFNKNFEPTEKEIEDAEDDVLLAKNIKKEHYYKNIELINSRFQEFAFATHPDAYDPKEMSELLIKDLALIGLSPDFKEWIAEGAHGTWLQAAIVAGNMDYETLAKTNFWHYAKLKGFLPWDISQIQKEAEKKIYNEIEDLFNLDKDSEFVKENSIRNGK